MEAKFGAVVRRRTKVLIPILDTAGKPTGKQEEIDSEITDDPVMDDAGNPMEAASADAILKSVLGKYKKDTTSEIVQVWIRKTETVQVLTGDQLKVQVKA